MTKDECLALAKALDLDWEVIEFPPKSGMYIFIKALGLNASDNEKETPIQ